MASANPPSIFETWTQFMALGVKKVGLRAKLFAYRSGLHCCTIGIMLHGETIILVLLTTRYLASLTEHG